MTTKDSLACTTCGSVGPTRKHTPGSIWIEIVLWLFFIVPGLIYSIWRLAKRQRVCAACGATTVVPLDTPAGRAIAEKLRSR